MAQHSSDGPDNEARKMRSNLAESSDMPEGEGIKISSSNVAFAAIPKILDEAIERHDKNAAIRSTTIQTSRSGWIRNRQENLMSSVRSKPLSRNTITSEKNRAFDLLDALSRSGCLSIPFSELHILICVTHRFDKNVMETLIQDNINPIEKLKLSTLLMASTILDIPARDLVRDDDERKRLETSFPLLLLEATIGNKSKNASSDEDTVTRL